ncbi:MAG TPA: universal stress protein [Longimicrobiales bacterium]|nr:universal stress protein [Longimicrobiales bacterium]
MFRKVLVAMDLSPATEALISALPGMRQFGTQELNLVHVAKPFSQPISRSMEELNELRARVNRLAESLRAHGFEVTADVPTGEPAAEIVSSAARRAADLILIGSRSRTRIQEAFVGSVSWDVVRQARRPVLLQRIEANRPDPEAALESRAVGLPRRVLHPTDFSDIALRAKPYLLHLAALGPMEFSLLNVLPVNASSEDAANARARLESLAGELREAGATAVRVDVRFGTPHDEILAAGGRDSDALVVMGTQGRGFLPGMILGSESRQVVRRASARTLLIPAIDEE